MNTRLLLLFVLLTPSFLAAQNADDREVARTEERRFQAMVERDFAALDRLLGDDLHYIHSDGSTDTKASFIAALREGTRSYPRITIDDLMVRVYHGNTAVLTGECTYHRTGPDGQPNNLRLLYTNVYVKRDGRWEMVSWQSHRL
jgi:uncharacterized protein (TIGR02246 family)